MTFEWWYYESVISAQFDSLSVNVHLKRNCQCNRLNEPSGLTMTRWTNSPLRKLRFMNTACPPVRGPWLGHKLKGYDDAGASEVESSLFTGSFILLRFVLLSSWKDREDIGLRSLIWSSEWASFSKPGGSGRDLQEMPDCFWNSPKEGSMSCLLLLSIDGELPSIKPKLSPGRPERSLSNQEQIASFRT